MKKIIFVLMWLALMLTEASAQKKIHWLLFIDTDDANVGQLDVNGRDFLRTNFVDVINSALTGAYQTDIQDNYGSNCNPYKCKSAVQNLNVASDDIVIFYYIGHGGRSVSVSDREHPWPKMWLGQDDPSKMIDLGWVHDQLKAKNPRLLLTIGMCCNVKQNLPTSNTPSFSQSYGSYEMSAAEREHIKKVFQNTCGNMIATSASPGQSSRGGSFNPELAIKPMDYYTALLCLNFKDQYENGEFDIEQLFKITGSDIDRETDNEQTPIYKASLSQGQCPTSQLPAPGPNPSRCRQMPSTVNVNDMTDLEGLMEAIVCNKKDMPNRNTFFASDCVVRILGQDGKTQVDRVSINTYMLRVRTSDILLRVVPVATTVESGKIKEFFVREYYQRGR